MTADPNARGAGTRDALLSAARNEFGRVGYDKASITEIVERAGASVGSLYHHFGGKADLWFALYDEHHATMQRLVSDEFRAAVDSGERDAIELFVTGTRAYLDASWLERELVRLFAEVDGPPGFLGRSHEQLGQWATRNTDRLADISEQSEPMGPTLVLALTTVAQTAGREVARQTTKARAETIAEEFVEVIHRLIGSTKRSAPAH